MESTHQGGLQTINLHNVKVIKIFFHLSPSNHIQSQMQCQKWVLHPQNGINWCITHSPCWNGSKVIQNPWRKYRNQRPSWIFKIQMATNYQNDLRNAFLTLKLISCNYSHIYFWWLVAKLGGPFIQVLICIIYAN